MKDIISVINILVYFLKLRLNEGSYQESTNCAGLRLAPPLPRALVIWVPHAIAIDDIDYRVRKK